jgi:hypothetical protein
MVMVEEIQLTEEQKRVLRVYADAGEFLGLLPHEIDWDVINAAPLETRRLATGWIEEFGCDFSERDFEAEALAYSIRLMPWLDRDFRGMIVADSPLSGCHAVNYFAWLEADTDPMPKAAGLALLRSYNAARDNPEADPLWLRAWTAVLAADPRPAAADAGGGKMMWLRLRRRFDKVFPAGHELRDRAWAWLGCRIWEELKEEFARSRRSIWPELDGNLYSQYMGWHRVHRDVLHIDMPDIWPITDQLKFGGVYPLNHFVVVTRRFAEIHCRRDPDRGVYDLHCDGGPAVRYYDDVCAYALNGVIVPRELAVAPVAELDPAQFATIANAEVRREFIRKVGIERIADAVGAKTIDKRDDYELLLVNLGGATGKVPYLKMRNPSIGVWHLEGVPPNIKTVAAALEWRNGTSVSPSQLT